MIIKEFILQGIRGFKESVRFQLNNGLNVFIGDNEKGKTTLAELLFFLLSVKTNKTKQQTLKHELAKEARVGITFQDGPDNYRLLMDLMSDAVLLSKYNQEIKKFTVLSKDKDEIKDFFDRELLFKPFAVYEDLYLINHYSLMDVSNVETPQTKEIENAFSQDYDNNAMIEGFESSYLSEEPKMLEEKEDMTPEEIKAEIEKLEKELEIAGNASKKQEQIDQLESELANIQNKIKDFQARKSALQEVENQVNELNKFSDLPDDIENKVDEYIKFDEKVKKDIENIERQKSQYETININIPPFYKNKLFIIGAGFFTTLMLTSILLSLFVATWGIYVSLGVFLGLGLMGYTLWKDASQRSVIKEKQQKVDILEKQIKEQRKKYEIEGSVIKSIVSAMKLDSPQALKDGIKKYKITLERFAQAKAIYNQAIAENNLDLLQKQEEKLKSDINTLQEEIRTSFSSADPYMISQRIDALKSKLLNINENKPQKQKIISEPLKKPNVKQGKIRSELKPSFMKKINILSEISGEPKEKIISVVTAQSGIYFKDLTLGRFTEIQITDNKLIVVTNDGKYREFENLADSVKEKCLFSILLSILSYALERWPWPIVIDEPFISLDGNNRLIVYNKLKTLSKEVQIIFFTNDRNLKSIADNVLLLQ